MTVNHLYSIKINLDFSTPSVLNFGSWNYPFSSDTDLSYTSFKISKYFNFDFKVVTTLCLSVLLIDCANMAIDFIININKSTDNEGLLFV